MLGSQLSINAIKMLGVEAINKANSGHPGMVLGSAPAMYSLFTNHIVVDSRNSSWINRDRFVLASGHASMLLYSVLHFSGFNISIEDIQRFRQFGSNTPGHPEVGVTDGVDATSGPLGQGVATAVGMAIAEKSLASEYNKPNYDLIDHYTYALCGDGDMQEGVQWEAVSLAGHLALGKLIVMYDSNNVTLDGDLNLSFSDQIKKKFEASHWQVIEVNDGMDPEAIKKAIAKAKKERFKPSLIINKTIIGYGSTNAGTSKVHGNPLGSDIEVLKKNLEWNYEPFQMPQEVYDDFKKTVINRGKRSFNKWNKMLLNYKNEYPQLWEQFKHYVLENHETDYLSIMPNFEINSEHATRDVSQSIINSIAKKTPNLIAGSADLASSVKNLITGEKRFSPEDYNGKNIYFGIREFAMGAAANGMVLHGGLKVTIGGFFVFSDYLKPAIRMAAISHLPVTYLFSHDSIAVGEDGATHQPIEQLAMLRSIPNLQLIRPADANETRGAYQIALNSKTKPTVILLTRQNLNTESTTSATEVSKGAYIVGKEMNQIDAIVIATGSEVGLALKVKEELYKQQIDIRVVSMPSFDLYEKQDKDYKESMLPSNCDKRISLEMGSTFGWAKYTGIKGMNLGIDRFGTSAPAKDVLEAYGFSVENIKKQILIYLNKED